MEWQERADNLRHLNLRPQFFSEFMTQATTSSTD